MKIRQAKESDLVFAAVLMKQTHDAHVEVYPHRYVSMSQAAAESLGEDR